MRWNSGSFYKKIRNGKGLSQREVCGNSISRTTLSKFENNKLAPSYDTMSYLLKQIDMSDEEFQFVCNGFEYDSRNQIIKVFFGRVSNLEDNELSILLEKGDKYLKLNDDLFVKNLMKIIQSLQLLSDDGVNRIECLPKLIVSDVWMRISRMDEWYYSELRMINSFMYYFPIETVISFLPKLLRTIERYDLFSSIDTIRISVLLNVGLLLIQNDLKEMALPLFKDAIYYSKQAKRYDYLSIAKVRLGICKNDFGVADEGFRLLDMVEELDVKEHLWKEWKIFSK